MKFVFEKFNDMEEIIMQIEECEGNHTQQVCYSSYHGAITQICFDCKKVRSNINLEEEEKKGKEEKK